MAEVMTLFDYHYWATGRVLDAAANLRPEQFIEKPEGYPASPRTTLVHVLSSEHLWRIRWETGVSPATMQDEDFPSLAALRQRWREEEQAMRAYLSTLDDNRLDDAVQFVRLSGDLSAPFTRWHLLMQLVNHGTHHRSEVAALLTTYGQSPGDLDFLFFVMGRS